MTSLVVRNFGREALENNLFLRDSEGSLSFVSRQPQTDELTERFITEVEAELKEYAAASPIVSPEDLFDESLNDDSQDRWEAVRVEGELLFVRLVERRLVGQDWLRGIQPPITLAPPITVFASHKGGVGRSTALAVSAAELARRGASLLIVDLDLEAPGLGDMFIPNDSTVQFGSLDYYVESTRGRVDDSFLSNMITASPLTSGSGKVNIVPAVGYRSKANPQNVVGKLARAYLENVDGELPLSFLDQTRDLIARLCSMERYDYVFVDARAGLNETTAATIQGLGADVLLFGVDTPQTWEGYRYFLAHLARFKPDRDPNDWRLKLKMVHAKASPDPRAWASFRDRSFELFAEHLYDGSPDDEDFTEYLFNFDLEDKNAPHFAWPIIVDPIYFEFDPQGRTEQLMEPVYNRTYGMFLSALLDRLGWK
jgi:hypothetical protein